jgi:hypothetical protein
VDRCADLSCDLDDRWEADGVVVGHALKPIAFEKQLSPALVGFLLECHACVPRQRVLVISVTRILLPIENVMADLVQRLEPALAIVLNLGIDMNLPGLAVKGRMDATFQATDLPGEIVRDASER